MKSTRRIAAVAAAAALAVTGFARAGSAPATVVDAAVSNGSFTTLVAALEAAGLVETLRGDGPFTVFAPTDAAFAKLPAGTVESLLEPANREKLIAVLTYHVVAGKVSAAQAAQLDGASTLQGGRLPIAKAYGGLTVGGAKVVTADVEAGNGVVHVVDTVLLPQQ
ncbi:MAG: fasciclin domain-containing protein [Thermoanaerobaculia bacterium]|nr:MAG: fasciclin domain-containing protein [Thermoanaerobaculia bacterium]